MSGTVQTPSYLMTIEIVDNTTSSITALRIRDCIESLAALVAGTPQTASYTPQLTDRGTCIEMNSTSGLNFTVPPNSGTGSVAFQVGTVLAVCQINTGTVTFVAGTGVTIDTPSSLTTRARWSTAMLRKRGTNEWVLSGDLT